MLSATAITLPEEQVAAARRAVAAGRAASVSAFISQALARRDADEEMAETIAEIYAALTLVRPT